MSEKLYRLLAKIYRNIFNFEIIVLILIGVALLLKNQGILGGSILLTISITIMANLYFYCALYKDDTIGDGILKFSHKMGFYGLTVLSISILFKLQHWPNPNKMIYTGILLVLFAIGVNAWKSINQKQILRYLSVLTISLLIEYYI